VGTERSDNAVRARRYSGSLATVASGIPRLRVAGRWVRPVATVLLRV